MKKICEICKLTTENYINKYLIFYCTDCFFNNFGNQCKLIDNNTNFLIKSVPPEYNHDDNVFSSLR